MTLAVSLPGAEVRFTTRAEGNLGHHVTDDPAGVAANVEALRRALGLDVLRFGDQVHGVAIRDARVRAEADGAVTREPRVGCGALGADCLPIALIGDDSVAMVHAGWPGLAKGVIAAGVQALGGEVRLAVIGPGAGACCYEVGPEVAEQLGRPAVQGLIDLKAVAREQLTALGAGEVHDVGLCTMCDERFFSHRRDGGVTGRQAGIAWLT